MTLWCHSDVDGGPGSGSGDTCQIGGAGAGTDAQVGARFAAFPHGTNVPNNGFVVRAVTSDDVTTAAWGVDWGADAQTDPNARDQGTNCTLRGTQANFKTWECVVTDLFTNDNAEGAFFIFDNSGGAGYCAAAGEGCLLDVHYIVSSARSVATVTQSFVPGGGGHTHSPPSPAANAGCQPGETAEKTHTVSSLGATEIVEICMVDNFGDPFNGAFTEEVSAPGDVDGGDCTARDHNNDGRFEHCDGGTVGVDGAAQMQVSNFNNTTGTVTITSCFEGEPGVVPPTAQPTDHGCTDEATAHKDTLTLNYGTQPSEVFLAFTDPAPLNPSDPCRTGITFKRNQVGDTDNLIACTYDSNGNPVPTDTNAFRIVWDIQAAQGGEQTAVRFTGSPPQETSGSTATATTSIVAERQGDNFITVRLQDPNANIFENFSIEKQVEGENQPQNVATNLSANKAKRKVRGRAATPRAAECRSGRQVTLFKRVPGPNQVIGQDTTNNFGRYSIGVPKPRPGRYYARVTASTATDSGGQTLNCLADQSDDVRFRRHRR
jgi:hypothetical protein